MFEKMAAASRERLVHFRSKLEVNVTVLFIIFFNLRASSLYVLNFSKYQTSRAHINQF